MRRLLLPLVLVSLAACTLSLPLGPDKARPAALGPGTVTVTPLDSPAPVAVPAPVPVPVPEQAATGAASQATADPATPSRPAAAPEAAAQSEAPADPAQPQAGAPPPTAEQITCEAQGGLWSATGTSGLRSCLQPTRDAGKSCRKESDCDGLCLARSRTCAPVRPLFGCNDILQADGSPATLCLD